MAIEDSSLYEDVVKLVNNYEYCTKKVFYCTLVAGDFQCSALSVNSIIFNRDYVDSYADSTIIEIMLPMGTYTSKIYPNRQKLFVLIQVEDMDSKGARLNGNLATKYQRFRATILDSKNPSIVNFSDETESEQLADTGSMMTLSLQLTDEILESIRQSSLQTIVKNTTLDNLVKGLLKSDFIKNDNLPKASGVLMSPSDNPKVFKQITLSPTLNAIDTVDWLQDNYGIYNNGLGVYLQKKYWYVFPLLQTEKFKADENSITIIAMPPDKMAGSEKTFLFKDDHLMIIATGNINQIDNTDSSQRNVGNGLRYINAGKVIDKYSTTKNGKTRISRKNNIVEFKSMNRNDGKNYIPFSSDISKVNHANAITGVAKSQSNTITVTWENSMPVLLLPGMHVRFLYRFNNKVRKLTGTLINVTHHYSAINPGILQNIHSSASLLTILAQSVEEDTI